MMHGILCSRLQLQGVGPHRRDWPRPDETANSGYLSAESFFIFGSKLAFPSTGTAAGTLLSALALTIVQCCYDCSSWEQRSKLFY